MAAGELIEALSKDGVSPNKTTVYRQLEALVAQGVVNDIDLGEGKRRYEMDHGNGAHPHLLCTRCGRIECLPVDEEFSTYMKRIAHGHHFELAGCTVELFGLCPACQKASNAAGAPADATGAPADATGASDGTGTRA